MKKVFWLALGGLVLAGCASEQATEPASAPVVKPAAVAPAESSSGTAEVGGARLLPGQPSFASPEAAVDALNQASEAKDLKAMAQIMGLPEADISTSDPDQNMQRAAYFAKARAEYLKIVPGDNGSTARVFIGKDNCPLASPLVRVDGRWFFDSAGGKAALIDRLVRQNEEATIGVCRAYVTAQYEYYAEDRNGDDVLEYAQKLGSTRGQKDGLYWYTKGDEPESPLGALIAEARATGYLHGSARKLDEPKPYHGYLFQILSKQGPHAPGGAYDYVINGRMVAGFALVAYPAKWGFTGRKTFLVGANGVVYQKDLGAKTAEIADQMDAYDPDASWARAAE